MFCLLAGLVGLDELQTFDCNLLLWDESLFHRVERGYLYPLEATKSLSIKHVLHQRAQKFGMTHEIVVKILLTLRDTQLYTGLAMTMIGYIQTDITQYHFQVVINLALLSITVCQAADFVVRPSHFRNPVAKHARFAGLAVLIILQLVAEFVTWKDSFWVSDNTLGLSMECTWKYGSINAAYGVSYGLITVLLLLWTLWVETTLFYPSSPAIKLLSRLRLTLSWTAHVPSLLHFWVCDELHGLRNKVFNSFFQDMLPSVMMTILIIIPTWTLTMIIYLPFWLAYELWTSSTIDVLRMNITFFWASIALFTLRETVADAEVGENENEWGFGQILPLLLLIVPSLAFGESLYDCVQNIQKKRSLLNGVATSLMTTSIVVTDQDFILNRIDEALSESVGTQHIDVVRGQKTFLVRATSAPAQYATDFRLQECIYRSWWGQWILGLLVPCGLLGALLYAAVLGYDI